MQRRVDYQPLVRIVTKAETSEFKSRMRDRSEFASTAFVFQAVVAAVVLVPFGIGVTIFFVASWFSFAGEVADGNPVGIAAVLFPLPFLAVLGFAAWSVVRLMIAHGRRWSRWLRLGEFASKNGLIYSPSNANPSYPGAIFGLGNARTAVDHLRSASERFLDYGNYRYTTGSGKSRTTHTWGFLALALDRALPHMVLDSRANNGLFGATNLPATFDRDQVLHLEGDFDKYFTLYSPQAYERDALYVFTPDLMALLIDEAAPFDVEVIDQWLFVYSKKPFDMTQPAVHQRLLRIVDTIGAKTLSQTDRYVDDRVGVFDANLVAPQGQRLSRAFPIGAVVVVGVFLAVWFTPIITQSLGQ
jgi:hypothetical protein